MIDNGIPQYIRSDNGPEFIAKDLRKWLSGIGVKTAYIEPGSPWENAYVERFNRTVRYEWLSQHYWQSIDEVQMFATQWMYKYNHQRPNMALGGITPKQRLVMAA